jgi:hypothetical protein
MWQGINLLLNTQHISTQSRVKFYKLLGFNGVGGGGVGTGSAGNGRGGLKNTFAKQFQENAYKETLREQKKQFQSSRWVILTRNPVSFVEEYVASQIMTPTQQKTLTVLRWIGKYGPFAAVLASDDASYLGWLGVVSSYVHSAFTTTEKAAQYVSEKASEVLMYATWVFVDQLGGKSLAPLLKPLRSLWKTSDIDPILNSLNALNTEKRRRKMNFKSNSNYRRAGSGTGKGTATLRLKLKERLNVPNNMKYTRVPLSTTQQQQPVMPVRLKKLRTLSPNSLTTLTTSITPTTPTTPPPPHPPLSRNRRPPSTRIPLFRDNVVEEEEQQQQLAGLRLKEPANEDLFNHIQNIQKEMMMLKKKVPKKKKKEKVLQGSFSLARDFDKLIKMR